LLQLALVLGIRLLKSREGNDAVDIETGEELELKTVNILKTQSFSTHHHMNPVIITKYRKVPWIFATYEGIELRDIWRLTSADMEHWFGFWEDKWHRDGGKDINNPKVPLSFVRINGKHIYSSPDMPHGTNMNASLGIPTRRQTVQPTLLDPPYPRVPK
jgi:Restriction endonuclease PvuII